MGRKSIARTKTTELKSFDQNSVETFINDAINSVKAHYEQEIATLKIEIQEIKESQQFISSKYDKLKTEYESLANDTKKHKAEISQLNLDSSDLAKLASVESAKLDNIEQYGRRQNLEFKGIPQTEGEDTNEIVINLAKLLKVNIKKSDIST